MEGEVVVVILNLGLRLCLIAFAEIGKFIPRVAGVGADASSCSSCSVNDMWHMHAVNLELFYFVELQCAMVYVQLGNSVWEAN